MRKAFDANVPKLRPRLKTAAPVESPIATDEGPQPSGLDAIPARPEPDEGRPAAPVRGSTGSPRAVSAALDDRPPVTASAPTVTAPPAPPARARGAGEGGPVEAASSAAPVGAAAGDVLSRRDRLEHIKRRVADAAKPAPRIDPVPADPARAAESVLGLVRDLEGELGRAREREEALRADLDGARQELATTAGEARGASERLGIAEKELEEKRGVLSELLAELEALEDERDAAVRRAQALSALDEERAKLLEDLGRRAEEEARLRAEREAEVERLSEELRLAGAEGARLRAAVGELARERDVLGADLDRARHERDELAEAKKALEAVHAALAQARARIG